jgi:hypothetical protein
MALAFIDSLCTGFCSLEALNKTMSSFTSMTYELCRKYLSSVKKGVTRDAILLWSLFGVFQRKFYFFHQQPRMTSHKYPREINLFP